MKEFRYSNNVITPIRLSLGGVFAVVQGFLAILMLSFLFKLGTATLVYMFFSFFGVVISAFYGAFVGLMKINWTAIIAGIFLGIIAAVATFFSGNQHFFYLLLPLLTALLGTYLVDALLPDRKVNNSAFGLKLVIAGHILSDIILLSGLLASIWLNPLRPFVFIEALLVLLGWYLLRGCPFTVLEVKLHDTVGKGLEKGFLVYYSRAWLGFELPEKINLVYLFMILFIVVIIFWFI